MADLGQFPSDSGEEVEDLLREGRPRLATQALIDAFADCLPELPLRFSLLLVRVDEQTALEVAQGIRRGDKVSLTLTDGPREALSVYWGARRVGDLAASDRELVLEFGEHRALYTPRVLEILFRPGAGGGLQTFAIELVRPEQRRCPRCGRTMPARSGHRCKTDPEIEARPGQPAVALHGPLASLISDRDSRRRSPR
ncbi:hypothetical protein [Miltoncostaea oceani]|uniref:hypothetical protein n=1 Tax=Miltoncostaea oceani TaxID=2843216 RepID=UPI001C3E4C44|nr:hypothetical protein [Miltoncostaea oceani]